MEDKPNNNIAGKGRPFPKGVSPNPGGRPSIAKALEANGTTTTDVLAKLAKIALETLDDTKASERSREYAHTWLTNYTIGKPKDRMDVNVTGVSEAQLAHVGALALTPHERQKRIAELHAQAADEDDLEDETDNPDEDVDE